MRALPPSPHEFDKEDDNSDIVNEEDDKDNDEREEGKDYDSEYYKDVKKKVRR